MGRSYLQKDLKLLWGFSAGRCSYPNCKIKLVLSSSTEHDKAAIIGNIAHIYAHAEGGPRFNPDISEKDRNSYDNLILLCGTHHDMIDKQPNKHPTSILLKYKKQHEKWVDEKLAEEIQSVSFAELEKVVEGILVYPVEPTQNLTLIPLKGKINKNNLSSRIEGRIITGMIKSQVVREFVQDAAKLDPFFPEKLSNGFIKKYSDFRKEGLEGDSLFEALHEFASGGFNDFEKKSAGLAILVYLFELCEVFEK